MYHLCIHNPNSRVFLLADTVCSLEHELCKSHYSLLEYNSNIQKRRPERSIR